jgi:hypothetical protein
MIPSSAMTSRRVILTTTAPTLTVPTSGAEEVSAGLLQERSSVRGAHSSPAVYGGRTSLLFLLTTLHPARSVARAREIFLSTCRSLTLRKFLLSTFVDTAALGCLGLRIKATGTTASTEQE